MRKHLVLRKTAPIFGAVILFIGLLIGSPFLLDRAASQNQMPPAGGIGIDLRNELVGAESMRDAGAKWTRLELYWRWVEYERGTYNWAPYDQAFGDAAALGYDIILLVRENPPWAADTRCGPIAAEAMADFTAFLQAAVQRYSAPPYNVRYWELYNEPDNADPITWGLLGGCWGRNHPGGISAAGAGGAAYAAMMMQAYPAIKSAYPDAQVLLGGMAYDYFFSDGGPFDPRFFEEFLQGGGGDYIDIINFHYYPGWHWRWDDVNDRYNSDIIGKANHIRNEMQTYGAGLDKPLLCTEVGYPSHGVEGDNIVYSEELQSRYVFKGLARAMSADLHPIIWFNAIDEPDWVYKYGLIRSDMTAKPGLTAYQTYVGEMSGATFISHRLDVPDQVEGYVFAVRGQEKTVIWSSPKLANVVFTLSRPGGRLRQVFEDGSERQIVDGGGADGDGAVNGQIKLVINGDPSIVMDAEIATHTPTSTPTHTPTSTPTPTPSPTATPTPTVTPTSTPGPSSTPTSTPTPSPTAITHFLPLYLR